MDSTLRGLSRGEKGAEFFMALARSGQVTDSRGRDIASILNAADAYSVAGAILNALCDTSTVSLCDEVCKLLDDGSSDFITLLQYTKAARSLEGVESNQGGVQRYEQTVFRTPEFFAAHSFYLAMRCGLGASNKSTRDFFLLTSGFVFALGIERAKLILAEALVECEDYTIEAAPDVEAANELAEMFVPSQSSLGA